MAGAVTAAVNVPSAASAAPNGAAFASLNTAPRHPASPVKPAAAEVRTTSALSADRFSLATRKVAFAQADEATAAKKAAAKIAARKAAARKAAAQRAAARKAAQQRAAVGSSGSPRQVAQAMLGQFGWSGSQYGCLVPLWGKESGWSTSASNPSSGAYGIPQALPGNKMSSAGPDWQSNPATQIKWGLQYIQSTYGSPCGAWSHEQSAGWY
ncbi:MAG: lytic transglycosylase domain-containing protein [Streptosporangiales bacterium]|nr:lytic transglycosylase domain-containing protein [Streptosporangiales bacterium]